MKDGRRDSCARIAYLQHDPGAVTAQAHDDLAASRRKFFGVAEEVAERLNQASRIGVDPKIARLEPALEAHPARLEARAMVFHRAAYEVSELDVLALELDHPTGDACDVEQ